MVGKIRAHTDDKPEYFFNPIQTAGGGGGGAFDATQDLNPLLLTNDCVYSVPIS